MYNFYPNRFEVEGVKPLRKKRSDVPDAYNKEFRIGKKDTPSGSFWTSIKIIIKEPNIDYPKAGLFVSVNNGRGNCYSNITVEDISGLIDFLQTVVPEVEEILSSKQQISEAISKKLEEIKVAQEAAKHIIETQE